MAEITLLTEDDFPPLLREIPDTPEQLFLRGTLAPQGHKLLAVVGSRRMSRYGKDACETLIRGLAGSNISIVSGLALGIDAAAHRAAITANLHTVAVPGSGISDSALYPASNRPLAKQILNSGGALLSEFAPDFRARPESFPQRNRIMAGMSHAILIIEATERSGTLITAKLATEYNRELLVVPHSIFAEGGAGGHVFMKLGAAPVRSATDILDALGLEETSAFRGIKTFSPQEKRVFNALAEPLPRDELIRTLGLPIAEANALLLGMELKGSIQERLGEVRRVE